MRILKRWSCTHTSVDEVFSVCRILTCHLKTWPILMTQQSAKLRIWVVHSLRPTVCIWTCILRLIEVLSWRKVGKILPNTFPDLFASFQFNMTVNGDKENIFKGCLGISLMYEELIHSCMLLNHMFAINGLRHFNETIQEKETRC